MRSKSNVLDGIQVFGVAGTETVSFGITATAAARVNLLGFGLRRKNNATGVEVTVHGYKVFKSLIPKPTRDTSVSTFDHPIQSFVWDDYDADPSTSYTYTFVPMRLKSATSAPKDGLAAGTEVPIKITTEALVGTTHDIYFNRGVTAGQYYAQQFDNKAPKNLGAKRAAAEAYLSNGLDKAIEAFIAAAQPGDTLRCCFYEFTFAAVLDSLKAAIDRGVDVKIIVDMKENQYDSHEKQKNGTIKTVHHVSAPRTENLKAIKLAKLPDSAILARVARKDAIAHNKFMVLVRGGVPLEVWTGSTNITDGGIYGQANVGHRVKQPALAATYLAYWTLLSTDPGAPTAKASDPVNVAFRTAVENLTPTPASIAAIPNGVSAVFSPRDDLGPLNLYVQLLASSTQLGCITLAFGIPAEVKAVIKAQTTDSPLKFMLLDKKDAPTAKNKASFIQLNWRENVYEAFGAAITSDFGKWITETTNRTIGLNTFVSFVHLKFLLRDPLGADPIVVTGSANFSDASTITNDENMIVVRGDLRVADIYFTEFNRLWGHYYVRAVFEQTNSTDWQFLDEKPGPWLANYADGKLRSKRVATYEHMVIV